MEDKTEFVLNEKSLFKVCEVDFFFSPFAHWISKILLVAMFGAINKLNEHGSPACR